MPKHYIGWSLAGALLVGFIVGRLLLPDYPPDTLLSKIEKCREAGGQMRYYTDINLAWIKSGRIEANTFMDDKPDEARVFRVECYKEAQTLFTEDLQ